ncbi:hypothetical protein QUF72_21195 [Desulfobacterales bacterium HSG2]|nr:hypothetical protein [Desulfobacterales bacterium HSG2]
MVVPAPKKKTDNIISKLLKIVDTGLYDIFTLKWCKNEAKKLKKQEVLLEEVFTILGIIACIEGNIEKMHSYHRNALGYSGETYFSLYNYTASLMYSSLYQEAYEYALKAFDLEKNEKIMTMILHTTHLLNKKDEFTEYAQLYKKLYNKEHDIFSSFYVYLRNIAVPMSYADQRSEISDIINKCAPGIVKCFGYPFIVELEIMQPVDGVGEQWIAWIMSTDNIDKGLDKMDMFHDWCIEKQADKGADNFNFNINFLGNNEF